MNIFTPENPQSEKHAIVLVNHLGSSARSDTGRDAEQIANYFDLLTIAVDRPGSALDVRPGLSRKLELHYMHEYDKLGKQVVRQLDGFGVQSTLLTGRSAGGSGALALGHTSRIPNPGISVFEPIGWSQMSVTAGKHRYHDYLAYQRTLLADTSEPLVRPDKPGLPLAANVGRLAMIPLYGINDTRNNGRMWAAGQAYESARYVAHYLPEVPVDITFAARSMAVTPHEQSMAFELSQIDERQRGNAEPFHVHVEPHTVHASFDKRELIHRLLSPAVGRMLLRETEQPGEN
jgi:hypothetical protein